MLANVIFKTWHPSAYWMLLTLVSSSGEYGSDETFFSPLILRVGRQRFGAVIERAWIFTGRANHGAGVPHGRSRRLVFYFPVVRHLQLWKVWNTANKRECEWKGAGLTSINTWGLWNECKRAILTRDVLDIPGLCNTENTVLFLASTVWMYAHTQSHHKYKRQSHIPVWTNIFSN